jgi:hypothetical protein
MPLGITLMKASKWVCLMIKSASSKPGICAKGHRIASSTFLALMKKKCGRKSDHLGSHYLTAKGMARVKTQLDADEKATRDAFLAWITPTIGLIGVLIGFVAVVKR